MLLDFRYDASFSNDGEKKNKILFLQFLQVCNSPILHLEMGAVSRSVCTICLMMIAVASFMNFLLRLKFCFVRLDLKNFGTSAALINGLSRNGNFKNSLKTEPRK